MTEIDELKTRLSRAEADIAILLPYRDRVRFLEDCKVDIVWLDPEPVLNLPACVQLQKCTGKVVDGKPEYALLSMQPSLTAAIDEAIRQHTVQPPLE